MKLRIPRESFLVFPTPSTLYDLLEGLVSALAGGFFMVSSLNFPVGLVTLMGVGGGGG